jgi:hypothetical protein
MMPPAVGAFGQRGASLPQALHLADHQHSRIFDARDERRRITKGQHDRGRRAAQCLVERRGTLRNSPSDKAATHALVAGRREFAFEPFEVGIATTDQT